MQVLLYCCTVQVVSDAKYKMPFCFELHVNDASRRTLVLQATTNAERLAWVARIEELAACATITGEGHMNRLSDGFPKACPRLPLHCLRFHPLYRYLSVCCRFAVLEAAILPY